ncbi:uncharacterized protein F5891DRAFT_985734 [Suillus fuscotomentosus]|uniref:Uncharacterized protein n=1 Tax=Suillus fuscotomentosus TaxID=1912939 RepID=A0AAD4DTD1_9AGAM|nr:uncharacterized protein F5891DRAFT_985734 [Suillus fuscotomentosus]KAG1893588.1 hypothetical protein F5891DRAFT_985734 [Suillus fuscotomentosus]
MKTPGLGSRIDIVLTLIRQGFFFGDNGLITENLPKAERFIEEGGDWLKTVGALLLDALSTFIATELNKRLRKSLANKKGGATATLLKQAQALVRAQLDKEAISLASVNVPELRMYVSSILSLLLEGAMCQGSRLIGSRAFEAYLDLAKCCSARLDTFHKWVGVATLRSLGIASVPEELQAEQLSSLVPHVLYRLRSLSEQTPFDAATFSYAFPLLAQVLLKGGVDAGQDDGVEALEQITLVLDIIKFHCSEFSDAAFPRTATMEHVLHAIRHQPRPSKEASSVLIDLGEAVQSNVTRDEVRVLIDGTLLQGVYVRNACLQAIQPFDLTDLDWSPQLWIACHNDDKQNARLANHAWEDNGLDVPEDFLDKAQQCLLCKTSTRKSLKAKRLFGREGEGSGHAARAVEGTIDAGMST